MNFSRVILSALLILSLSRCTTFEDRSACGCRLVLNLDRVTEILHPGDALKLALEGPDGFCLEDRVFPPPGSHDWSIIYKVPSGEYTLSGATSSLSIPPGEECPPLYLCHVPIDARGESVSHTVVLHKNYCLLTLIVKNSEGGEYPFEMNIEGNVNGCEADGTPTEGPFRCTAIPRLDGIATVRLPRQKDNSLTVSFSLGENRRVTFALGEYIAASGYDWAAPDLEDITIQIDWASTNLTLTIDAWTHEVPLDVML